MVNNGFHATLLSKALLLIFAIPATAETNMHAGCIDESVMGLIEAERTCISSPEFKGERCFFTKIPECAGENAPLVFDMHGYDSCPMQAAFYTKWAQKSDDNCFVLVYPTGMADPDVARTSCWGFPGGLVDDSNMESSACCCHRDLWGLEFVVTDDQAFLRQVAAVIARDTPRQTSNKVTIDTKRIYMGGHSNGCIAAIGMGTLHSDFVAGVGCHSGTTIAPFPNNYNPTPMFLIHGTADTDVNYEGDQSFFGLRTALSLIANANGCTSNDEKSMIIDDNYITEYSSTSCTNNATVVLYAIAGVGHFPYLDFPFSEPPETVVTKADTTQAAWDFLKTHSLQEVPELIVYDMPTEAASSSKRSNNIIVFFCSCLSLLFSLTS